MVDTNSTYLVVMEDSETTRVVKCKLIMDGGMVEFHDAATGKFTGCCGIRWFERNAVKTPSLRLPPYPTIHPVPG